MLKNNFVGLYFSVPFLVKMLYCSTRDAIVVVSLGKDLGLEWIDQFEGHPSIRLKDSLFCLLNQDFNGTD